MLSAANLRDRVTIGAQPLEALRRLSDARALTCPLCRRLVVLKAGTIRAPHFAHMPGAVCSHPDAEPESERHRAGKAMLARWLSARLPDASIILEAPIEETGQRADLLIFSAEGGRVAIEFQCADLGGREWKRRHALYREAAICDLWILGANRLIRSDTGFKLGELERTLWSSSAPLLFLDPLGERLPAGHIGRLRVQGDAVAAWIHGSLSARPLDEMEFPWRLLGRGDSGPSCAASLPAAATALNTSESEPVEFSGEDARLMYWLRMRYRLAGDSLPAFFGIPVRGAEAIGCSPQVWQACVYYRWVHERLGEAWRLEEVNVWARKHLPIAVPTGRLALKALEEYQALLAAAGFLSIPHGKGSARVQACLDTMDREPDPATAQRIAAYRRTLSRSD